MILHPGRFFSYLFREIRDMIQCMYLSICLLAALLAAGVQTPGADTDGDGLPDDFEQALLNRFAPTLMISGDECDGLPAEFRTGFREPHLVARNGVLYGQASKHNESPAILELHFYHLWNRDCGRAPHALDPEHVSVLIAAGGAHAAPDGWKALYWYAAAHEETPCDASNGAYAAAIGADSTGATVWVSRGKHGSFLSPGLCGPGCGSDSCNDAAPMPRGKIVNLGEPGAPANGALWVDSKLWRLREKMHSDFPDSLMTRLRDLDRPGASVVAGPVPPAKALILSANRTFTAMKAGTAETGGALNAGGSHAAGGVGSALTHTARSLQRTVLALARALQLRK